VILEMQASTEQVLTKLHKFLAIVQKLTAPTNSQDTPIISRATTMGGK
jgi:hypothetical protein